MAWIKVPPQNHPLFHTALPKHPRVTTMPLFGGVAAKVNGHIFAGQFARSTMVWLTGADRVEALALDGASLFDPMGDGRARSDKVMLPEELMDDPTELRRWLSRAFEAAALLPPKVKPVKPTKPSKPPRPRGTTKRTAANLKPATKRATKKPATKRATKKR